MEAKYFLFSTDADKKCRYLSDSDFREVFCAVFNFLRDGVEPEFENYLLYDYYEKVLSTPYFFLSTYDPSRRSKKKTDEICPPKTNLQEDMGNETTVINCNGREVEKRRKERKILERIVKEPEKYRNGASWENICIDFDDIEPYSDRLLNTLESLNGEGKIKMQKLNDYTFSIKVLEAV